MLKYISVVGGLICIKMSYAQTLHWIDFLKSLVCFD